MACQTCGSERILFASGRCNNCCFVEINGIEHDGYVPSDLGIGDGDYLELSICLDCGQSQGEWPAPESDIERNQKEGTD